MKIPKYEVGNQVIVLKNTKKFLIKAKGYIPNWSEEAFAIKDVKNTVTWNYLIEDLNEEEIIGTFYKKESQKSNQK